jgi:hypothetical protein
MFEPPYDPCKEDPMCLDNNRPLLKNVRTGLIDPTTPKSAMSKISADGTEWKLVVSLSWSLGSLCV